MTRRCRAAYDGAVPRPTLGGSRTAAPTSTGSSNRRIGAPVSIRGVSKWFRTGRSFLHALDDIDIEIQPGEFVSLIGPSGCGKSTLLRVVGGLLPYETGTVEVNGTSPATARDTKQIGFAGGAPPQVLFIGIDGVADFLNLPKRRNDRLAIEDRRYLFFGEPVAFDRQRPANGTDAIGPSKAQIRPDRRFLRTPDSFPDPFGKIENGRSDRVWRCFGHGRGQETATSDRRWKACSLTSR